jgi:uncharacterized protein (TIGR03083 family)
MRAYGAEKAAVADLVRDAGEAVATVVPASPAWTVRDVLAHLVGVCQSQAEDTAPEEPETDIMKVLVGWNEPDRTAARDRWTGEMVAARRERSVPELLEEWDGWERAAVATVNRGGLSAMRLPALVTDLVLHSQDLRAALGVPGDTTREAGQLTLSSLLFLLDLRITAAELPALRVEEAGGKVLAGKSAQGVVLAGTRHELIRALGGRRTRDQIAPMLTGDGSDRYLPLIPLYDPPEQPLPE